MYGVAESVEDYRRTVLELRAELVRLQAEKDAAEQHVAELDNTVDQLVDIVVQREAACHALKTLVESMVKEVESCQNRKDHDYANPNLRSGVYQSRYNEEVKRLKVKYGKDS